MLEAPDWAARATRRSSSGRRGMAPSVAADGAGTVTGRSSRGAVGRRRLPEWRDDAHAARLAPPRGRAVRRRPRRSADPEAGWRTWRDGRDELFASHPDSPLDEAARATFPGLPFAAYDPALRFEAELEPADAARLEVPTAADGVVPLDRIGTVALGDLGRIDVWWLGGYGGGRVPAAARRHRRPRPPTAAAATCSTRSRAPTSAGTATGWSSTSTSPTTRRARTTRAGVPPRPGGQPAADAGRRRGAAAPRRLVLSGVTRVRALGARGERRRAQPWARAPSELKTRPIETSPCWIAALVSGPPVSPYSWKLANSRP